MTNLFTDIPVVDNTQENDDYFTALVGEGKKYKDTQALAKAVLEKDRFIGQLQTETRGLREDLSTRLRLEEALDRLQTPQPTPAPISNAVNQTEREEGRQPPTQNINELIATALDTREKAARERQNVDKAKEVLAQTFGHEYPTVLEQKAKELGITNERLNDLAKESPELLFRAIGVNPKQVPNNNLFSPPTSTHRAPVSQPNGQRDWNFYEKLRKEQPELYWDPKTQNQILKDAMQMGDAF